jgi:adenosylhomocysteine nucleosidase
MGAARAHEAAERALDRFSNPELIIVAGVAGALIASLRAADIVIADRIIAADGDARAFSPADSQLAVLRRAFESARLPYESGGLLTSRTLLSTANEKRRARESTGAVAVDMETAAIAAAADARGLAVIAIRTILDELDDDLPGPGLVDERGKVDALRVAGYLLRRPGNVLKLPRLARNMSRATRNLADAVELAIRALSAS